MESNSRLYSQVAAQADVAPEIAMAACYLADLSHAGKSLDDAICLLRRSRSEVRGMARDWGISFPDYSYGEPLTLEWRKEKPGRWTLDHNGAPIANIARKMENGCATYEATALEPHLFATGSSAEVAARRLSLMLETASVGVFSVDDVEIRFDGETVAPKRADDPAKLRRALNS